MTAAGENNCQWEIKINIGTNMILQHHDNNLRYSDIGYFVSHRDVIKIRGMLYFITIPRDCYKI